MLTTINGIEDLKARAGEDVGVSDWYEVTQDGIDAFADATSDHQWIHVDPERAQDSPFGGTIAHGYYTLSLASHFMEELLQVDGVALMVNYGLNKVRFMDPLPVGDRVRMHLRLAAVDDVRGRRAAHLGADLRARRRQEARVRGGVALARLRGLRTLLDLDSEGADRGRQALVVPDQQAQLDRLAVAETRPDRVPGRI